MFAYSALYKPVKNILTTGAADSVSLSVNTKANQDLSVGIRSSRKNESGVVDAGLSWTQKLKQGGVALQVSGDLDQEGTVTLSTSAVNIAKGVNADVSSKLKTNKDDNKVTGNLDYTHEKVHLTGTFDYGLGKDLTLKTSVVGQVVEGLVVGGEVQVQGYPVVVDKKALKTYNLGARYSLKNIHVAALLEDSLKTVRVGYAQQIDESVAVAGEFTQDLKSEQPSQPTFTLGASYVIDKDSSVKAKINTKGTVNTTYTLQVNPRLTTSVSVEANAFNLSKGTSKVGVSVNYSA
ncbi:hypothetical protein ABK040_005919 [Willaertia magna]